MNFGTFVINSMHLFSNKGMALRRWLCIMLMENFQLDNHDKLFAHWTNESMDLLKGHRQPVMHLRKCKLKEIEALSVEEQGQRLPVISVDDPKVTFLYHQISFLLQKHHKMQISLCCLFQALRVEEEEEPPVKTMNIEDMQEASNLVAQLKEQNLFKR
ncbi:uncharacterized protein [Misgurnus anguillicaudatus]|uniref:uncharacterized protein isoform X1 n=1 Tax=Misgurnus anguillicaudatus TaxID=75329 RepID=UPI003CCFA09F